MTGSDNIEHGEILDLLDNECILSINIEDGKAIFTEGCDRWFSIDLNKEQVGKLIEELKLIYKKI